VTPTLSLVTVVRNGVATISDCLASVRKQTMPVEHIVIDGGSEDGTLDVIRNEGGHVARVISEPDEGIYDAMNKGVRSATGEVVGTLNVDDFYPHDKVLDKVTQVFKDPSVDACYGDLQYVDATDPCRVVRHWRAGRCSKGKFYRGWMPPHPTFFVRRKFYALYGMFNADLGSSADYELMLRLLLKHDVSALYIPEVLVKMRTGGVSNASFSNRLAANRMDRRAWTVNSLKPHPWTIALKPLRKVGQFLPVSGRGCQR
jgi:glycosyltransferase involved in cell wall biosynthesis